jgi:glycerophosphoryl diester phosphodiesterase
MARFLYGKPLILAHRCLYPGYPENTLVSLQKVIQEGADYVEIDCEFTLDNKIVVSHDHSIDRSTNGTGNIADLRFDEIRKYNAAHYVNNPSFGFVLIPTFEEILQTIQNTSLRAELHIKNLNVLDIEEFPQENVPDLLLKYHLANRCNINIDVLTPSEFLYEFDQYGDCRFSLNAYIDENLSQEKQMQRLTTILNSLKDARFIGLDLKPNLIEKAVSNLVHDFGMELQCYPTNDPDRMQWLIENECDVIQTDRMDLLKEVCQKMGFDN